MARAPLVTLRLTTPPMRGELVREVQSKFRGHGLEQDGIYGPTTARAVAAWQWKIGSQNHAGAITPFELLRLLGYRDWRTTSGWAARRRARKGKANPRLPKIPPSPDRLVIVPRSSWNPYGRRGTSAVRHGPGTPHVVHWFGPGRPAGSRDAEIRQVVGFARYHMFTLGWSDLGYNYVCLSDGTILEARGDNVRGAHSGHNVANTYPGVLLMAGTLQARPTDEAYAALVALRKKKRWGRRYGHVEFYSTSCPGTAIMPWIRAHR